MDVEFSRAALDAASSTDISAPLAQRLNRHSEKVYRVLREADAPVKAYDILEALHEDGVTAPTTVYRALESLIGHGLARKVASINAFVAMSESDCNAAVGFVTCRECGEAQQVLLDRRDVLRLFEPLEIPLGGLVLEASGGCWKCSTKACQSQT